MEILHTTNEEPFVSGTGHFAGWENRLMKLEDTAILFISRKTKCSTFAKHFVPKSHLLTQFKM